MLSFQLNTLFNFYQLRDETIKELGVKLAEQDKKIAALQDEIAQLKELLKLQKHRRFGKKSEAHATDKEENPPPDKSITVAAHTRKKAGRLLSTDHLPHFQTIYDLAEHEKTCVACHGNLHKIGEEKTSQLEIIPTRYCVVEHIQMKYACRQCETIKTAEKPLAPIPKAIAGASVLADVIVNKYQFHQPLYRQSKMMLNEGLTIPDNTLGNWMIACAELLKPVYQALWSILNSRYLQVDETPVKILEPNKKGYLWTYYAPHVGNARGLIAFELSETRSATIAESRLRDFNGLLQTDAYGGYKALRKRKGIVGLGCLTHARRKFDEVIKISHDKDGVAAKFLGLLKPLYELEAMMREKKLGFRTRKRLRQKIAWPQMKLIHRFLRETKPKVPPKSKLGQAIQYTLTQWPYLFAYLRHGEAEIDTNGVENKIREIALGKKNWLFIGNTTSGQMHAIFYSLVLSSQLNGINPRVYLHYLLTKVHELRRNELDPITLLPQLIDKNDLQKFIDERMEFAKKMLSDT